MSQLDSCQQYACVYTRETLSVVISSSCSLACFLPLQGYAPRYPNQPLPPLDPYVENDIPSGYRPAHTPAQLSPYAYASRLTPSSNDSPQVRRVGHMLLRCRDTQDGRDAQPVTSDTDTPLPLLPHELADLKQSSSDRLVPTHSGSSSLLLTIPPRASGAAFKYSCPRCQKETIKCDAVCADCVSNSQ